MRKTKLTPMRLIRVTKDGEFPEFITLVPNAEATPSVIRDKILRIINSCENITHTLVVGKMIELVKDDQIKWELKDVLYAKGSAITGLKRNNNRGSSEYARRRAIQKGRIRPTDDDIFPNFH